MTMQEGRKEAWPQPCISLSSGKQTLSHTPNQGSPSSPGPDPVHRGLITLLRQTESGFSAQGRRAYGSWVGNQQDLPQMRNRGSEK